MSPIQVVPKKSGITVLENEKGELVLQRMIILDIILERLAGQSYYCFLDGYSGYNQVPVDPHDQEKNYFHLSIWHFCLSADALWLVQCTCHLSKVHDVHLFRYGGRVS